MIPHDERIELLRAEARRLAASGGYATWQEVEAGCVENGMTRADATAVFAPQEFRDDIEALAEAAHGVGGPATE